MRDISSFVFIQAERLILKTISFNHCTETYLSWLNDKEVNTYLDSGMFPTTLEDLKKYVESVNSRSSIFLAIHIIESDKHIGNIKIDPINSIHGLGEYGIMIGDKSEWGKGYAKEATIALIDHCFKKINLRKITLGVVHENIPAVNLYQSIGFQVEGHYKNHGFYNGKYMDILRMAIFQNEWKY